MIDRVHFENFKSLQDVTIDLGRFTALVGPNGCGKTSVLEAMYLLSVTAHTHRHGRVDIVVPQRLTYRNRPSAMVLSLRYSDGNELRAEDRAPAKPSPVHALLSPREPSDEPAEELAAAATYLQLDTSKMMQTSVTENEHPRMAPDGSGLASALAWMKGAAEDELARLTSDLRHVVPGVRRIRTLRERVRNRRMERIDIDGQPVWRPVGDVRIGDRFELEFDDGSEIPSDLLSEGTVHALGLLAKLHEPGRPHLVLLDDIDRGLHLGAQVKLVQVLRKLMELEPELQIVCTTHSPYLLDLFEPAEVRVLALDAERRTHARPLTEHPEFGKWKFGTQTGELWAALGEEWVISGASG